MYLLIKQSQTDKKDIVTKKSQIIIKRFILKIIIFLLNIFLLQEQYHAISYTNRRKTSYLRFYVRLAVLLETAYFVSV